MGHFSTPIMPLHGSLLHADSQPFGYISPASDMIDFYDEYFIDNRFPKLGTERIVISCDGPTLALPYQQEVTQIQTGSSCRQIKVIDSGENWDGRYISTTVVKSKGLALEIYEGTNFKPRPFTNAAISYIDKKLGLILSQAHPSMPSCSIKKGGNPEMHLVRDGNNLLLCGYANPRECGYIYAAVFNATSHRLAFRWTRENTVEYIGWSSCPEKLFFYCVSLNGIVDSEGLLHIELRFKPDSGDSERCLVSREFTKY